MILCPLSTRNALTAKYASWHRTDSARLFGYGPPRWRCPVETVGYVYTFDDLTELRRLERDLRIQDRLAAVGRLAAAIAHEIRNPLTSIAGSVSMLSEIADLSDEHRQLLQIVTRESERLNDIITDFLAYSRGKHYQFTAVDLLPLLEDTLTLLEHRLAAENRDIRIERNYNFKEALAMADGDKIKQVFWNFCENALRAMGAGGVLSVSVEQMGDDWQINFADTGPGMSRQLVEKIFEPFQSQFEGGTGLGLAIVYQIVQAHEGKVWARSRIGEGSVFVLRLRRLTVVEDAPANLLAKIELLPRTGRKRCGDRCNRREGAWVTFWSAMTSVPSAKCWTLPCVATATKWKP